MTTLGIRVFLSAAVLVGGCLQEEKLEPPRRAEGSATGGQPAGVPSLGGQPPGGQPPGGRPGSWDLDGAQLNGVQLNGAQLNGVQLNGVQLNGVQLNGVQLNGVQLNGVQLNGVQLNGSQLSARSAMDAQVSFAGPSMSGALFALTLTENGSQVSYELRLDSIYADPLNPTGDVYLYDVSVRRSGAAAWDSLCKDAAGKPVPAVPLANYWDSASGSRIDAPSVVTLACSNAALGKCVRWGYRPWASATMCYGSTCSTVSLADHHQACTRMVRADYCGDGTAHTVDGTPIDVFDNLQPSMQTRSTSWQVEAKWTPRGATCLGKTRAQQLLNQAKYPDCNGDGKKDDFAKCDNDDYSVPTPSLLGNAFDK